jgi:UDP-3-O-[3-hydroxymyristoyl] glucosamine N-acyltransferase
VLLVTPGVKVNGKTLLQVKDPRAAFARAIALLQPLQQLSGIHPSAVIDPTAQLGEGCYIGPQCTIGPGVVMGANCVLHANVTIYRDVHLGKRVVINAGAVIGADGFGFVMEGGRWQAFPQVGSVEIGDDVSLGAGVCVDRAALGKTIIGEGSKLDNMVHIAHNCRIGKHVVIAAQTGMAGGCEVGDYAVIGGQVGFGEKVKVEAKAIIGSGAGVLSQKVVRAGTPMWGTPARPLREYLRQLATLSRLSRRHAKDAE